MARHGIAISHLYPSRYVDTNQVYQGNHTAPSALVRLRVNLELAQTHLIMPI
jgi:hypothetical protein